MDRLVNDEDRKWFEGLLAMKMRDDFGLDFDDVVTQKPYLFCDFADDSGADEKVYAYSPDHPKVWHLNNNK